MPYTSKEILNSSNPYSLFEDGDAFAEHRKILDALSDKDKNTLAVKIITECPKDQLKNYYREIKALAGGSFQEVISKAHQLKTRILNILDHRNKNPQEFFLDESALDLINEFHDLATTVISGSEMAIAERLALCTKDEDRSKVATVVSKAFSNTDLPQIVQKAFTFKRNIQILLGPNPKHFFTSREFNSETCREFSELTALIKGKESAIGESLIKLTGETRQTVEQKLALLSTMGHDEANPFKLITDSMGTSDLVPAASKTSQIQSAHIFFAQSTDSKHKVSGSVSTFNM